MSPSTPLALLVACPRCGVGPFKPCEYLRKRFGHWFLRDRHDKPVVHDERTALAESPDAFRDAGEHC